VGSTDSVYIVVNGLEGRRMLKGEGEHTAQGGGSVESRPRTAVADARIAKRVLVNCILYFSRVVA
jgi:hypothetical protein